MVKNLNTSSFGVFNTNQKTIIEISYNILYNKQEKGGRMETAVLIVSILLIAIVLLQSGKAESADIIQGSSSELFQNRKERGVELFISRLTFILGFTFFVLCIFISFM